jgi:hypothetical protein
MYNAPKVNAVGTRNFWRKVETHSMMMELSRPVTVQQIKKHVYNEVHLLNRGFEVTSTRKFFEEIKTTGNALRSHDELTDDVTQQACRVQHLIIKTLKYIVMNGKLYSPLAKVGIYVESQLLAFCLCLSLSLCLSVSLSLSHTHTHTHTHTRARAREHIQTHAPTHTHKNTHAHKHTETRTHAQTRARAQTHGP